MKIQAFPIIAVVTALLPIVCGAPASNVPNERADKPEEEDRSCKKREADAQKAHDSGETVESCNYFCKPYKNVDYYSEKKYPVGTKCKYLNLVSKCTEEGCPYPTESGGENKKGEEKPGGGPTDEAGKEEEKPGEEPNDEAGREKEKKEEESTTQGEEEKDDTQKDEPKTDEEKGKEGEEGKEGEPKGDEEEKEEKKEEEDAVEEEEEDGELEKESTAET